MISRTACAGAAIAALLVGCAHPAPRDPYTATGYTQNPFPLNLMGIEVPVWIDRDFTAPERVSIHAAIQAWNYALNGYERFVVMTDTYAMEREIIEAISESDQGLLILQRSASDPIVSQLSPGTLAWTLRERGHEGHLINVLTSRVGALNLQAIVQHELGHVLGLPHVEIRGTMMYENYREAALCIDRVSMQTLATVRGWDWHRTNYCGAPQ